MAYKTKLNLTKYMFGMKVGKFMSFMVSKNGVKLNPEKQKAVIGMIPLKNVKEI